MIIFQDESSVQQLIEACIPDDEKLYLCVSSPTIKDKPVQIRPWRLSDADFVLDASMPLDPRKTVFVGGVPRPLKALELAMIMDRLYGGVCYAGIDTDPELKYPKVIICLYYILNKIHMSWNNFIVTFHFFFTGRWTSCILKSTKLYCSNISTFCTIAAW